MIHRTLSRVVFGMFPRIVAIVLFAVGCSSATGITMPSTPADISGRITSISSVGNFVGTIRVETNPSQSTGSPKAIATVNGRTVIFLLSRNEGEFRSLSVGQWVRVWFNGPVAESYPVQGTAATVVIDSAGVSLM